MCAIELNKGIKGVYPFASLFSNGRGHGCPVSSSKGKVELFIWNGIRLVVLLEGLSLDTEVLYVDLSPIKC